MKSSDIRNQYVEFFKEKGHTYVHSSPSVAVEDPTLMFTNAGMNQFKDIFLGVETRSYTRAVNSQKCIRVSGKHNDLEEVGHDGTHLTFFEMLGNWSFGDYYKKEAISWAWELLTERWGIPKDRLYASIFRDDDEAGELWKEMTDIAPERIMKFDEKDNFWEMGDTGPCGPCSEIHYDRGEQYSCGPDCTVNCDCGRFVEIWNLVFMQYNRKSDGTLEPLANTHVDTGMGFERICFVLNECSEVYDTDVFTSVFNRIEELTGKKPEGEDRVSFRVIADHIRMVVNAVCDGATPSNEGRGYVVRRVLRRGVRYANLLREGEALLVYLVDTVIETLGGFFTELKQNPDYIREVVRSEEESFLRTLKQGNDLFEKLVRDLKEGDTLEGDAIFVLYDTYGFPPDLVELMAGERGLKTDMDGFREEMEKQKQRSRAFAKSTSILPPDLSLAATVFTGYEEIEGKGTVVYASESALVTNTTPFYGEGGGQKGDKGVISNNDFNFEVTDTQKEKGVYIHLGTYTKGSIPAEGTEVTLAVNADLRRSTANNHTATHLLHHALREKFSTQVKQQGSMVDSDRFTFDFTFPRKITDEEKAEIEDRVNELIQQGLQVKTYQKSLEEAKADGIIALFDEKYGETVRVVDTGDGLSRELCGGTHVKNTADIGSFVILSEEAISAGNRRIEGCTGKAAEKYLEELKESYLSASKVFEKHSFPITTLDLVNMSVRDLGGYQDFKDEIHQITATTSSTPSVMGEVVSKIVDRQSELCKELGQEFPKTPWWGSVSSVATTISQFQISNKKKEKELKKTKRKEAGKEVEDILENISEFDGIKIAAGYIESGDNDSLNGALSKLQEKNPDGVCVLGGGSPKATLLAACGDAAREKGYKAVDIIRAVGKKAGGGGGGKDNFARGGGGDPEKTEAVLRDFRQLLEELS